MGVSDQSPSLSVHQALDEMQVLQLCVEDLGRLGWLLQRSLCGGVTLTGMKQCGSLAFPRHEIHPAAASMCETRVPLQKPDFFLHVC